MTWQMSVTASSKTPPPAPTAGHPNSRFLRERWAYHTCHAIISQTDLHTRYYVTVIFLILAIAFLAACAILGWVTGVVAGSAISLVAKGRSQRVLEDGFLGTSGGFTGFFLGWTYTYSIKYGTGHWLEPVWVSLAFAILLPFAHEVSRSVRPTAASLDFGYPGNLTPSRWNWLLFPFPFAIAYEMLTWVCWAPLASRWTHAQDLPFLEGQLIAFAGFRIGAVFSLALLCFAFLPRTRWRQTIVVAAIAGAVASTLDRFCWGWFNSHGGFLAALFGIPVLASGSLILIDRLIRARQPREATI
jgi:hypothetical protein